MLVQCKLVQTSAMPPRAKGPRDIKIIVDAAIMAWQNATQCHSAFGQRILE
jgi:hypothetical protein